MPTRKCLQEKDQNVSIGWSDMEVLNKPLENCGENQVAGG